MSPRRRVNPTATGGSWDFIPTDQQRVHVQALLAQSPGATRSDVIRDLLDRGITAGPEIRHLRAQLDDANHAILARGAHQKEAKK